MPVPKFDNGARDRRGVGTSREWQTFYPESNLESINVVVPLKSVNETLVCDHSISYESYWVVLSNGTVGFDNFAKWHSRVFPEYSWISKLRLSFELNTLGVKGLNRNMVERATLIMVLGATSMNDPSTNIVSFNPVINILFLKTSNKL